MLCSERFNADGDVKLKHIAMVKKSGESSILHRERERERVERREIYEGMDLRMER